MTKAVKEKPIKNTKEMAAYCAGDVRATIEMYTNKPSVVDILSGKVSMEHVPSRIVNIVGAETRR